MKFVSVFCIGLQIAGYGLAEAEGLVPANANPEADARNQLEASRWNAQDARNVIDAVRLIHEGRDTFRHDTFGDEKFWGDELRLHDAIAGEDNGGIGPGVSPSLALAVGLKVDVQALPGSVVSALRRGAMDLANPATTLDLLRLDSVLGVKGFFDPANRLESVGITCALCHSTVDDSFAPGIGRRLDGWAAQDLNVGAIIALAPNLQPITNLLSQVHPGIDDATVRAVLTSWGPGRFDAGLLMDGKAFRPDGQPAATLIPPAFGLAGVNLHTFTGWGSVTHWNAFVANLEMRGQGTFVDPRLNDASTFPIAAAAGFADIRHDPDLVTPKLAALQFYQLSIQAPEPPQASFDAQAARRGESLFKTEADCAHCHVPPLFTEPGWNMHTPDEIGIDSFQAERGTEAAYRTTPLKGLWTHGKRGYYHDGRFETLNEVLEHYDRHFSLGLSPQDKHDLVEYLKSL